MLAAPSFPLPPWLFVRILIAVRTFCDVATTLNRSAVSLSGLRKRFELPIFEDVAYAPAYAAFLRSVISLRTFDISEETLRDLWHLEKKLLQLIQVDSAGSFTWFLDCCGATTHPERRLLLTNCDLGIPLTGSQVQTGLNFADSLPGSVQGHAPVSKKGPCI